MNILVPAHSVIMIVGGRKAPFAEVAGVLDGVAGAAPWNVMKPRQSLELLHETMHQHDIVRVCMPMTNAKARRTVAAAARKRGVTSICLRLPGSDEVDFLADRFDRMYDITGPEGLTFEIVPMPSDRRHMKGPFDLIGDVHGCASELEELLVKLGHAEIVDGVFRMIVHADGRVPVLLGDLTDRGPRNLRAIRIAEELVAIGGLLVIGNHDDKLRRWLAGSAEVIPAAGLLKTIEELEPLPVEERRRLAAWLVEQQTHYVLANGALVAAHAGLHEKHHGRHSDSARAFALFGDATGKVDEEGVPIARDWALEYVGAATVVHGHVVHGEPRVLNQVVAVDTGCVFGGRLTAYRWPEHEFISVAAHTQYWEPRKLWEDVVPEETAEA